MAVDPRNEYHDIRILCRCAQAVGAGAVAAPCMKVESDSAKGLEYRTVLILQAVEAADQRHFQMIQGAAAGSLFRITWRRTARAAAFSPVFPTLLFLTHGAAFQNEKIFGRDRARFPPCPVLCPL